MVLSDDVRWFEEAVMGWEYFITTQEKRRAKISINKGKQRNSNGFTAERDQVRQKKLREDS